MTKALEQKLLERFNFFNKESESCITKYGFLCSDGWFDLIWRLCENIEHKNTDSEFKVELVREQLGSLVFYTNTTSFDYLIEKAEIESEHTCEICGNPGRYAFRGNWLKTLCPIHVKELEYRQDE